MNRIVILRLIVIYESVNFDWNTPNHPVFVKFLIRFWIQSNCMIFNKETAILWLERATQKFVVKTYRSNLIWKICSFSILNELSNTNGFDFVNNSPLISHKSLSPVWAMWISLIENLIFSLPYQSSNWWDDDDDDDHEPSWRTPKYKNVLLQRP